MPRLSRAGRKGGPRFDQGRFQGPGQIYRNIAAPSASIEPDYTSYTVATRAGQVVAEVVHAEGPDAIQVVDPDAQPDDPPR